MKMSHDTNEDERKLEEIIKPKKFTKRGINR